MTISANGVARPRSAPAATRPPRSQSGNARSPRNATKHGIRCECTVIPEIESIEEWEIHRDVYVEDLDPEGPIETWLAEVAAILLWKLARVDRFEREQSFFSVRQSADQNLRVLENRLVVGGELDAADQAKADFVDRIKRFEDGRFENDPVVHSMMSEMVKSSLAPAFIQNLVIRYRSALMRNLKQTLADLDRRKTKREKSEQKREKSEQKSAKSDVKRMEQVLDTVMGPNHHKDIVLTQDEYRDLTGETTESQDEVADQSQSEPVQSEPVQSEPVQSEQIQSEPVQPEPVQQATAAVSPAEPSSFGRNVTTSCPETTSETPASQPTEVSSPVAPSKGVDKHGFSLELTSSHRSKLWKAKMQKEKEEKRKRSLGNLPSNRPLQCGPPTPTKVQ